jgi:hypothetical protein
MLFSRRRCLERSLVLLTTVVVQIILSDNKFPSPLWHHAGLQSDAWGRQVNANWWREHFVSSDAVRNQWQIASSSEMLSAISLHKEEKRMNWRKLNVPEQGSHSDSDLSELPLVLKTTWILTADTRVYRTKCHVTTIAYQKQKLSRDLTFTR